MRAIHPYLFYFTYKFHAEQARDIGIRVEDIYNNKFHKEPYIMMHMYAQYFHPSTLLERVRDVRFYRQPRTMFKGFRVPDWAQAKEQHGWEFDDYSRQAWENAMHDFHSECTPMQFAGERQEPNILQWFRLEQWGQGMSSRLFYNEVPQPTWWRHGGHLVEDKDDDKARDRLLHSFTYSDQERGVYYGIDTTTEEGREQFRQEYLALAEMAPEIIKKENLIFPHEMAPAISTEPHFRRVWQHYREHMFKLRFAHLVNEGEISESDAAAFKAFVGPTGQSSFSMYILARQGLLDHLQADEGFQATMRVMDTMGLGAVEFDNKSARPTEQQFWEQFDGVYDLTEAEMKKELPNIVTDPANLEKVQALLAGGADQIKAPAEETRQLA